MLTLVFRKIVDYQEAFALVIRYNSIRMMMAIAAHLSLKISQIMRISCVLIYLFTIQCILCSFVFDNINLSKFDILKKYRMGE